MLLDEIKPRSVLMFAAAISGTVFTLVITAGSVIIYYDTLELLLNVDSLAKKLPGFIIDSESLVALLVTLLLALFEAISLLSGFMILGTRHYLGFKYYETKIYPQAQQRKLKGGKYPGKWQQIIFYLFRKGTVVEECLDNVKKEQPKYRWIRHSSQYQQQVKNMWVYANKIRKEAPEEGVYAPYYWSEICQCLDTVFILSFIVFAIMFIANSIIKITGVNYFHLYQICMPFLFSALSLGLHKISKNGAKAFADRFLFAIDKGIEGNDIALRKNKPEIIL
jgi:hypothetical protein